MKRDISKGSENILPESGKKVKADPQKNWEEWFDVIDGSTNHNSQSTEAREIDKQSSFRPHPNQTTGRESDKPSKSGFELNVSKTLPLSIGNCFKLWSDDALRSKWLPDTITIQKSINRKSMRITWEADHSHLNVYFYDKGKEKSTVSIQHTKLSDASKAESMKNYWKERLEVLKQQCSG